MSEPRKPWVIFATDRGRAGAPIRCVSRPTIPYVFTLSRRRALKFASPALAGHMAMHLGSGDPRHLYTVGRLGPLRATRPAAGTKSGPPRMLPMTPH